MKKKYKIGLHVLIWLLILLNDFLPKYLGNSSRPYLDRPISLGFFANYLIVCLGYTCSNMVAFYTTALLIAPAFLKKQWLKGMLFILLLCIFIPTYRFLLEYHFFLPVLGFDNYFGKTPEISWYIKNSILYIFYSYFIYGFIYFMVTEWHHNNRKQKELEKEKISAELSFLKSQINPHFLFNTLNDIYALTYQKSTQAPAAVLKLSALLRYMLKESDDRFAPLQREIDYLKNVIELHQIGQKGIAYINFQVKGSIGTQQIAPLILINFVENAFKHGVIDNPYHPIEIKLETTPDQLNFSIHNLKNQDQKDKTVGIGLNNVKRRLALIYPAQHELLIEDEKNTFTITLKVNWI